VVKLLVEREDTDLNRPDKFGQTRLMLATFNGHTGVARLLLERGNVNPNHPNTHSGRPRFYTAKQGHGVVQPVQARKSPKTSTPPAMREGRWHVWKSRLFFLKKKRS